MTYRIKPNWTTGAFLNAWNASENSPDEFKTDAQTYFKNTCNVNLIYREFECTIAEFENKEAYVLFMLEWS